MKKELQNIQIARYALTQQYTDLESVTADQLKRHLLDALGSMYYSSGQSVIHKLIESFKVLGDGGKCIVPLMGNLPYDRAAQLYTAMIRYPDFMDNYLGKEATCHPSDNIGPLLASCQFNNCHGEDFLVAMAVAYQIECRLVEEIPVMKEGIDHTLMLTYSSVASMARMFQLNVFQAAHALGIAGCAMSPLVTSRAAYTYQWKGLASSAVAMNSVNAVLFGAQNMTGPIQLFEGPKGFQDIFDMKLKHDWSSERFDLISKCVLKSYNSEVHTQPAVEAALELKKEHNLPIDQIKKIEVTTFLTAYHITGGGAYGDRQTVASKEQADHSLFYVVAVALLDGVLYPDQFESERIKRDDVQQLLQKVHVRTKSPLHKPLTIAAVIDPYTLSYPEKMKTKVEITLLDGSSFSCEKHDYLGFHTRPLNWEQVISKFKLLSKEAINADTQQRVIDIVQNLNHYPMQKLIDLLSMAANPFAVELTTH